MQWNKKLNHRQMPWKGEKDPYKIWLSEIILQQTRVEQGLAYYNAFVATYPTVFDLASAPQQQVFKLWEGLGYYSRCKNLISAATNIVEQYDGIFPSDFEAILALKGVGSYTAAAIASFAFNLPHAVVDGNVLRVLSRYFGIDTPIDTTEGRKMYHKLAAQLLHPTLPGLYNQAIMDFGATICKPAAPLCNICPQKSDCTAFNHQWVNQLPVKIKKLKKTTRYFYYFILQHKKGVLIRKRTAKDIWQNLYEFLLLETSLKMLPEQVFADNLSSVLPAATVKATSTMYKQQLTHQTIFSQFITLEPLPSKIPVKGYEWVELKKLPQLPFPKTTALFLTEHPVTHNH